MTLNDQEMICYFVSAVGSVFFLLDEIRTCFIADEGNFERRQKSI